MTAVPITVWKVLGQGAQMPEIRRVEEDESETFKQGTPVQIDSDGFLIASPAHSSAILVAGISTEPASNLTTAGTAQHLTQGSVPNQANASVIPGGVKPNDGKCGFVVAGPNVLFRGNLRAAGTVAQTLIGQLATLAAQSNGFWDIDESAQTANSGALIEIVELIDPIGTVAGAVAFKFTQAAQQLYQ